MDCGGGGFPEVAVHTGRSRQVPVVLKVGSESGCLGDNLSVLGVHTHVANSCNIFVASCNCDLNYGNVVIYSG
jgi:hypothetical protein